MAASRMLGLCAIVMAQLTLHTIHCDTQEAHTDTDAQAAATSDPQMLIQMTNNFASILESLTRLTPANDNQYDTGMFNSMIAQPLQHPQSQAYTGRPTNPNYNPFGPQNPNIPPQRGPNIPQNPQIPGRNPSVGTPIPLDARDCNDVAVHAQSSRTNAANIGSGVYMLTPQIYPVSDMEKNVKAFAAFCDMETDGGNWTVFQKRSGPLVGFYRTWDEYKTGFGFLDGDHWLGLERLHQMTVHNRYELRVDLEDFEGNRAFAVYDNFKIGDESTGYMLVVGTYRGTAKDSLTYHNNKPFTTKDKDHDSHKGSCAVDYKGAWWYNNCHYSNLNGKYQMRAVNNDVGMTWYTWKKRHVSLKSAEMKIRRLI